MSSTIFFLAHKFVGKKSRENFLWFISLVSISGIALGVISLMLVLGVMNGFSKDLKKKIVGANPTITVEGRPLIRDYRKLIVSIRENSRTVKGASPFLSSQVIFKSDNYMLGGIIRGIDPETEPSVTNLVEFMKEGTIRSVNEGIVLGSELAKELEVHTGDRIRIIGGIFPREKELKVTGIVEYGVYNYDISFGITSLAMLQDFFGIGDAVHGIGLRTDNIYDTEKTAAQIRRSTAGTWQVTTWIQKNKILFAALALEKKAMAIILILIVLVASFNIASTLMITVFRKTREIGILRAIGLSSREIRMIFFLQGMIIGIKGLFFGLVIGGILTGILKKYQFIKLPEFVYNLSKLPVDIAPSDVLYISLAVLLIVSAASLYPAVRAAHLNPAEALRFE